MMRFNGLIRIISLLFFIWLLSTATLAYRLEQMGAFASVGSRKALRYVRDYLHADPASIRLSQSYSQWALALNGTDASNYLKTGLGFADGKGIFLKEITPENPNGTGYLPYYYQAPGPPFLIGSIIKLFGSEEMCPYFVLITIIHFLTAITTCLIASHFSKSENFVFGAGLLALLCLPVLAFNFGVGIFCGEPLADLFIGIALFCLSSFWTHLKINLEQISYRYVFFTALGFGFAFALAAYFRDIYTTFAQFSFFVLILLALFNRTNFKQILFFIIVGSLIFAGVEYPWEKRNQRLFNEFTMTGSTYYGNALWYFIWDDYKLSSRWSGHSGHGLGNYLDPEKSPQVLALLAKDKKAGSFYALQSLMQAVIKKPWEAFCFKAKVYNTLWFGRPKHLEIFSWCLISLVSTGIFLFITRFRFYPQLYLFPLFLFILSPIIHYEHRYSQPFFLFTTPITLAYIFTRFAKNLSSEVQLKSRLLGSDLFRPNFKRNFPFNWQP